jgi:hypothetical protein
MPTSAIEMTPNTSTAMRLDELNITIAESRGVAIEDLAIKPDRAPTATAEAPVAETVVEPVQAATDGVLTDEQLAAQYRSQADAMYKEAKRLREQAEELVPTKKATKKTTQSA